MSPLARISVQTIVILTLVVATSMARSETTAGQGLFEKRCSACHKLPDPGQPPPLGWDAQLKLMAPLARLKGDQQQSVLAYLTSHSQQAAMTASLDEDRMFFEQKCSRCHSLERILLNPLGGDALQHVVSRMQNRSGTDWLSDGDVRRVLTYLETVPRGVADISPASNGAGPEEVFANRCSACHTLERVFKALSDESNVADFWGHTVSRMRGKAPQWLSEDEASEILDFLRSAASDQKRSSHIAFDSE